MSLPGIGPKVFSTDVFIGFNTWSSKQKVLCAYSTLSAKAGAGCKRLLRLVLTLRDIGLMPEAQLETAQLNLPCRCTRHMPILSLSMHDLHNE